MHTRFNRWAQVSGAIFRANNKQRNLSKLHSFKVQEGTKGLSYALDGTSLVLTTGLNEALFFNDE